MKQHGINYLYGVQTLFSTFELYLTLWYARVPTSTITDLKQHILAVMASNLGNYDEALKKAFVICFIGG